MLIHVVFFFFVYSVSFFSSVNDDMNKNEVYSKTDYELSNIGYI